MVSVDVVSVTLAGFGETVSPFGALTVRATGFAKPLILVTVNVAVVLLPACTVAGDGDMETVIAGVVELKVAVTLLLLLATGVNVQVSDVPLHLLPAQLTKALPAAGAAVRVTGSRLKAPVQIPPQLIPAGLDVTVPAPEPDLAIVTLGRGITVSDIAEGSPLMFTRAPLSVASTNTGVVPRLAVALATSVSVLAEVPSGSDAGSNVAVTSLGPV